MMKTRSIVVLAIAGLCSLVACTKDAPPCNPVNPTSSCYQFPALDLTTSIPSGDTLRTDTIRFWWTGSSAVSEFKWRIDGKDWTNYENSSQLTLILDDGPHIFEIVTRYRNGKPDDTTLVRKAFVIAALDTPGVFLFPRVAKRNGNRVSLELRTKGMLECHHISVDLTGGVFDQERTVADSSFVTKNTPTGRSLALVVAPGSGAIQGNMTLARFDFLVSDMTKDTVLITFEKCEATSGKVEAPIDLRAQRGALVIK